MESNVVSKSNEDIELDTWVEVVDASELKESLIEKESLPKKGLLLKKMHKSNLTISYEPLTGGLSGYLENRLQRSNGMGVFLTAARKKFCA